MNWSCQLMFSNQIVTNLPLANFQWTVPGYAISNYVVAADSSSAIVVTNFPLNKSNVVFYWIDGASNRMVQCSAMVNGKTLIGQATFNVARPTVTIATVTGSVAIDNAYGQPTLHYGIDSFGQTGISFSNAITMPTGSYNYGNTNYAIEWVQAGIYYSEQEETNDGSFTWYSNTPFTNNVLDTFYPYPPDSLSSASDSPHSRGLNNYIAVSRSDSYEMYLMFKPSGGQWVPLKTVNWNWGGVGTNAIGVWSLSSHTNSTNLSDADAGTYPIWTQNLTNFYTLHKE
jgi:hypothetical protein